MMEQLTLTSSFRMRTSTKDGTTILGQTLHPTKSTDTTDSRAKAKDHASSMKSNSLELRQSKTVIHNTSVMSSSSPIRL